MAGSGFPAPAPFVGRRRELGKLEHLLAEAATGVAGTAEIAGEPGMGKTRLLTELAVRARRAGWLVLSGRAAEAERHVPFSVLGTALEEAGPDALAALDPGAAGLLRTTFPALSTDAEPLETAPAERYRVHRAVRGLLEALAVPGGLVVLLDDLHWADEGTAEVVDHLLRRPPHGRLLLAVAHRPRQTSSLLRRALAQHRDVLRIELGPLTPAEVDELLPVDGDAARKQALYAASGGNPFYVQALAGPYADPEVRPVEGAVPAEVPESVQAALLAELHALSPEQLVVVRAAAVAGDDVPAGLIAKTAGSALPEVLPVLDELVRRDLLRASAPGGRFQFRHPLVRRVTYDAAGAGWRVAAHARAAATLREGGWPATELAHHVERSAAPGDPVAVEVLREAAAASLHRAPAAAVHWLQAALRLDPGRPDLLTMRAQAYGLTGQFEECRATLHELRQLLPAELTEQRARIAAFGALIERFLGRHVEARAQLLAELAALADQHGRAALSLKLGLANGVVLRADQDHRRDWPAEALVAARRQPERPPVASALAMCALRSHVLGRVDERTVAWLDESAMLVDAAMDAELAAAVETVGLLGSAELCHERLDDAVRHLTRALRIVRAAGQSHVITFLYSMLGGVALVRGDLDRAAAHITDELDSAHLTGSPALRSFALRSQSTLAITTGDAEAAVRLGKEALALAEEAKLPEIGLVSGTLGAACFLAGDAATCVELMTAGGGGPDLWQVYPVERGNWYETLAAAEASLGHSKEAGEWADRAFAQAAGLPRRTGLAHLARAHTLADPRAAAEAAVRAVELLRGAGDRMLAGRAHVVAGTAFGASADVNRAREHFGEACALFEACGAPRQVEQALRTQRRVNAQQPRRRSESADDGTLTARERQVAELVAQGLTNSQIGEVLYVSPKTVAVHVGRLLTKLGVARRGGIASRLPAEPEDR
ncbi:AAA family ATPase [Amycolatopsis sp. NPDC021455]|uniref:helix-turn-helix transcriptional regulator n=1 Tax=Amycolatopsis sp. NPDC021455 TaxID=3154901 RepID=UPI0033D4FF25